MEYDHNAPDGAGGLAMDVRFEVDQDMLRGMRDALDAAGEHGTRRLLEFCGVFASLDSSHEAVVLEDRQADIMRRTRDVVRSHER